MLEDKKELEEQTLSMLLMNTRSSIIQIESIRRGLENITRKILNTEIVSESKLGLEPEPDFFEGISIKEKIEYNLHYINSEKDKITVLLEILGRNI